MSFTPSFQRDPEDLLATRLAEITSDNEAYQHDAVQAEPSEASTKVQTGWQAEVGRLMMDIEKTGRQFGQDTTVGYACSLSLKELGQQRQSLEVAYATRASQAQEAACRKQETADKLLALCIGKITHILQQKSEFKDLEVAGASATCKSASASNAGQSNSVDDSNDNTKWWHQIRTELAVIALLLTRQQVTREQVKDKLKPVLEGQHWIWDSRSAAWCSANQKPMLEDDVSLADEVRKHISNPIIDLGYTTDKDQLAAPVQEELVELFKELQVPCLTDVLKETPIHEGEVECTYGAQLLKILLTCTRNWAQQCFQSSKAQSIIDELGQRIEHMKVHNVSRLVVQYQLPMSGAADILFKQDRLAHWYSSKAGASTLLLRSLHDASGWYQMGLLVTATAAELAKVALKGSTGTADIKALAIRLQPLIWHKALQIQGMEETLSGPEWQQLFEAMAEAAQNVTARVEGQYHVSMRQFFEKVLLLLSGRPGAASNVRSQAWKARDGSSADLRNFKSPALGLRWLLLEATKCGMIFDVNILAPCIPHWCFQGLAKDQTGKIGEVIVTLALMLLLTELGFLVYYVEDMWPYGEHFEIRARAPDNEVYYLEVKSTSLSIHDEKAHEFDLSRLEYQAALHHKAHYLLVRLYGVPVKRTDGVITAGDLKMLVLKGPFEQQPSEPQAKPQADPQADPQAKGVKPQWIEISNKTQAGVDPKECGKLVRLGNGL